MKKIRLLRHVVSVSSTCMILLPFASCGTKSSDDPTKDFITINAKDKDATTKSLSKTFDYKLTLASSLEPNQKLNVGLIKNSSGKTSTYVKISNFEVKDKTVTVTVEIDDSELNLESGDYSFFKLVFQIVDSEGKTIKSLGIDGFCLTYYASIEDLPIKFEFNDSKTFSGTKHFKTGGIDGATISFQPNRTFDSSKDEVAVIATNVTGGQYPYYFGVKSATFENNKLAIAFNFGYNTTSEAWSEVSWNIYFDLQITSKTKTPVEQESIETFTGFHLSAKCKND